MIRDTPNCLRSSICPSKLSTLLHQVEVQSVGDRRESPWFRETLNKCGADTPVRVKASIVHTFRHKQVLFRLSLGIGPERTPEQTKGPALASGARGQECPRHTNTAELRSAWTGEGARPHTILAGSW